MTRLDGLYFVRLLTKVLIPGSNSREEKGRVQVLVTEILLRTRWCSWRGSRGRGWWYGASDHV